MFVCKLFILFFEMVIKIVMIMLYIKIFIIFYKIAYLY